MRFLPSSLRAFAAAPGFTVAAVLSLALGIGANSAIFSVANALLLRPLPYQDPDRLVILWNRSPGLGITEDWFSTAQYFDVKADSRAFEQVAIALGANANLTGDGPPERVGTIRASSNLLPMLGVTPALGRLFASEEDTQSPSTAAILSHGLWERRFGRDPGVVGRTLVLNGQPAQVVGVLGPSFSLPKDTVPTLGVVADAEILLPLPLGPEAAQFRGREDYNIVAKLRAGVSIERAQAEMDALTRRLRADHSDVYPPNSGLTFSVVSLNEQVVGDVRRSLVVLLSAVAVVLLIACANVANLLLSRALARRKEIAVRTALGASRGHIVRQLLSESLVLSAAGGALGLAFAAWSLDGIRALGQGTVPRMNEIAIDWRVLVFTAIVSMLAGVLFGLAPAIRLGRADVQGALKEEGRGAGSAGALWARGRGGRRLLVVAELALSVTLLIGAGLLFRSFARLQEVPPGFDATDVLTLELTTAGPKYADPAAVAEVYRRLWARLRSLPGVTAAGGVSALPLSDMMSWGPITVEGRIPPPGEKFINVDQRLTGAEYFQAMRIPLRQGRFFSEQDTRTQPRVAIADEAMAEQLWPGASPLGKRIRLGPGDSTSSWVTIVGVVGRVKQDRLDGSSRAALYLPHTQFPARAMQLVVRTAVEAPGRLSSTLAGAIREVDADLPIYNVRTMQERVEGSLARRRFSLLLLGMFALLALGLAAIGTYGVIAYLVGQGRRELGIRMALGATPVGILVMIVRHGATLGLSGVALGVAGAAASAPLIRALLFGVDAIDPLTYGAIAALMLTVALAASLVPAIRAARVDPIESLRSE